MSMSRPKRPCFGGPRRAWCPEHRLWRGSFDFAAWRVRLLWPRTMPTMRSSSFALGRVALAGDGSPRHDHDAVGHAEHLLTSEDHEQDPDAREAPHRHEA